MLQDFPFEVDFFASGSGLRFSGNIINYIDRLVYFCGAHEKFMLTFLRDYIKQLKLKEKAPLSFIDVGANAGNHTLFMATLVDKVYAFEPFERVRKQMEYNLSLNKINNVTIYPCGLSNDNVTMPFYVAPDTNLGASTFTANHKKDNDYAGDMQLRRGDDVAREENIQGVSIIKADVEGYEKFVLEGLKETIKRDRPLLIVELSASTRNTIKNKEEFLSLFPKQYDFYYFSAANYNTGSYRLTPYHYQLTPRIEDVIACPQEKLTCLLSLNKSVTN